MTSLITEKRDGQLISVDDAKGLLVNDAHESLIWHQTQFRRLSKKASQVIVGLLKPFQDWQNVNLSLGSCWRVLFFLFANVADIRRNVLGDFHIENIFRAICLEPFWNCPLRCQFREWFWNCPAIPKITLKSGLSRSWSVGIKTGATQPTPRHERPVADPASHCLYGPMHSSEIGCAHFVKKSSCCVLIHE